MTHTLHRRGTTESLSEDYIMIMIPARGINYNGHVPKVQEFLRIALRYGPKNIGSITMGSMFHYKPEDVISRAEGVAHAVYDNPQAVTQVLRELRQADLGLSVVVSGVFNSVEDCCRKVGLKRHTVNFSLGIWGKKEKLPSNEILEITTMCGHALISTNLVKSVVAKIKAGAMTPEDAAKELTQPCACGIFNPVRAIKLLEAIAK